MEHSGASVLSEVSQEDEFCFKSIKLDKFGRLKESMSLPVFKYCDLITETWENSKLRMYFANQVFAFTVFKEIDKDLFLKKIVLWKMPEALVHLIIHMFMLDHMRRIVMIHMNFQWQTR